MMIKKKNVSNKSVQLIALLVVITLINLIPLNYLNDILSFTSYQTIYANGAEPLLPNSIPNWSININKVSNNNNLNLPFFNDDMVVTTNNAKMNVISVTERAIDPGGLFHHKITLLDGKTPLRDQRVIIEDPINMFCTSLNTNHKGEISYITQTKNNTKPGIYSFVFSYNNLKTISTVSVRNLSPVTMLKNYSVSLNSTTSLNNSTLIITERVPQSSIKQTISTTATEALKFGRAVGISYLSNPVNVGIIAITAVSCTIGQTVLAIGQSACAIGVKTIIIDIGMTAGKEFIKYLIDNSTSIKSDDKKALKQVVELSHIAISLARFKPSEGIKTTEDVINYLTMPKHLIGLSKIMIETIKDSTGAIKGASFAIENKDKNEVLQCSFYVKN